MSTPVAERLEALLSPYLGPNTARNAVRTFSRRALGKEAAEITATDAPALVEALHPMLRTLLGETAAHKVVGELRGAVRT